MLKPTLVLLLNLGLLTAGAAYSAERTTLKIGVADQPPLVIRNEQESLQGLLIDVLEEIARTEKWQIQYRAASHEELLDAVQSGSLHGVIGVSPSISREGWLDFSRQRIVTLWGQVYSRNGNPISHIADLQNKTIALPKDTPYSKQFRKLAEKFHVSFQAVEATSQQDAVNQLLAGEVDAAVLNNLFGARAQAEYPIYPTPLQFEPMDIQLAVLKGQNQRLVDLFDMYIGAWSREPGSYFQQALHRWGSGDAHPAPGLLQFLPPMLLWSIGGGLLALLALVYFTARWQARRGNRKALEELAKLRRSERQYRSLVEYLPYGLQEIDALGNILFTNAAEHALRRYREGELIGRSIIDMTANSEEKARLRHQLERMLSEQPEPQPVYLSVLRKDGQIAELRWEWSYKRDEKGNILGFLGLISDATGLSQTKQQLLEQHADLRMVSQRRAADLIDAYNDLLITATVFEHTREGILVIDAEGRIKSINPALAGISGQHHEDLIEQPLAALAAPKHKQIYDKLWEQLTRDRQWEGEVWNERKNQEMYPAWLSINAVLNAQQEVAQYVVLLSDITKRKQYEKQIWKQANFDTLTGLPNRNLFYQRLGQALAQTARPAQGALMFIDLDKFKEVNDTLGHDAGDELLKAATQRISACARRTDTVARMGGDEFTIILPQIRNANEVGAIATHILQQLIAPFTLGSHTAKISASIGIVLYPDDGDTLAAVLKNADIAMYRVKESGRNGFCFFSGKTLHPPRKAAN
jgi:diguanylate cyclase (GGDEF)-like protein/PAS domain S-box-containing protein